MYQRVGKSAYKADLNNTLDLSEYLNHPEHSFKSIHVAGTNGKGSTSHMLASVLQEAGYKVGLYTSPHLKDFRERIKVNGKMISKRSVSSFVQNHIAFFESKQLSFFEMTVGLAFDYFRKQKIDIAVIEVGMGGRLDSTNVITPEVSVITNIGKDHTQFLGDTLEKIAIEKGGIIKPNIPVVIGETQTETQSVFKEIAAEKQAEIIFADTQVLSFYPTDLLGEYQKKNQKTVLSVLNILKEKQWKITESHIAQGLKQVVENTGLLGRWQILSQCPKIICDTAHNKEGLELVFAQLRKEPYSQLHIILGMVGDKDVNSVLAIFPKDASYYFCTPNIPRGLPVEILSKKAMEIGLEGASYTSVLEALNRAKSQAGANDVIYIGGSTFVVAEVL